MDLKMTTKHMTKLYALLTLAFLVVSNAYAEAGCTYKIESKNEVIKEGEVGEKPIFVKLNSSSWKSCTVSKLNHFTEKWKVDALTVQSNPEKVGVTVVCNTKSAASINLNASVNVQTKSGELKQDYKNIKLVDKLFSYGSNLNTINVGKSKNFDVSVICYSLNVD